MIKPVKRNKNKKFISAKQRYWKNVFKVLESRSNKAFSGLESGGKIVWENYQCPILGWDMLAAYRKTDKYRCKPLMYKYIAKF